MNKLISICIPTYNRSSELREGLNQLTPLAARWDVPIVISDNASTDETVRVVAEAKARYSNVHLHRNSQNIGMDGNFEVVLRLATTQYAWLLGDDDRIHPQALERVIDLLSAEACDLLLLNGGSADARFGRVPRGFAPVYTDPQAFLFDLGWHATWISGLVISTRLIASLDFKKYRNSYFSHFGSLFDALAKKRSVKIQWCESLCYYPSPSARFSWAERSLEIFADKWTQVVLSLPDSYSIETKRVCMLAHSRYTNLFSVMGLLNLRAQGAINRTQIAEYRNSLAVATDTDLRLVILIASLPVWMLERLRQLYVVVRNLKQGKSWRGSRLFINRRE